MQVALLFDSGFSYAAALYEGVCDYAAGRPDWRLLPLHGSQEAVLRVALERDELDGVIAPFLSDRWVARLPSSHATLVNISGESEILSIPSVLTDDEGVGRMAAAHLLGSGLRRLACLHQPASRASLLRRAGFLQSAVAAGAVVLEPLRSGSPSPTAGWDNWLAKLQAPVGIFATNDYLARRGIEVCRQIGRSVPDEIAIVGAGDSPLDSVLAGIGLSSVKLPAREIGRRAAARLSALMHGDLRGARCERVPPERVIVRASSAGAGQRDPVVARALAYLDQHLSVPLPVARLARAAGASRRTLEKRFLQVFAHSPGEEIRARRMAMARELLRNTKLSVTQIAPQCGFPEIAHFTTLFRRRHGLPPAAWRTADKALTRCAMPTDVAPRIL
ncbi:MAG: substrate-binding domain-containing protein [bacterium]